MAWLRRALGIDRVGPPHEERCVSCPTDAEHRFDVVSHEAQRVMRRAEEANQQARQQAPSWEELLIGKER